jgi:hypothetical protein
MALPFGNTLNRLAINKGKKFVDQVDNITENAPVVKVMPFRQSTDQLYDVSAELKTVSSVGRVDLNAPLPEIQIADGLKQTQLNTFGAQMFVPEDTATQEGGPDKYFANNRMSFERQTGMDMEKNYIYNAFLPFALAMNKAGHRTAQNAGGSANKNYCILVVRFDDVNFSGLYSPLMFKRDTFLDIEPINGGKMYINPDPASPWFKVLGYGLRMKSWLGVRMLSHRNIGSIVNVDLDTATPLTVMMMNKALLSARSGEAGRTFIFCHPMVKLYLDNIGKIQFMGTEYGDSKADFQLEAWNGVPIVTSYNFVEGAETNISV